MLLYFNFLLSRQENMKSIFELSSFSLLCGDTFGKFWSFKVEPGLFFIYYFFSIKYLKEYMSIVIEVW